MLNHTESGTLLNGTVPVTVLLIEDDVAARALMCIWLRQWAGLSMRCVEVDSVEQACIALKEGGIDLIILDWSLAGTSGIRTLRSAIPLYQQYIPIEIVSGNISRAEGLRGIIAGADDYWQKSGEAQEFRERVQNAWARSQNFRKLFQALEGG